MEEYLHAIRVKRQRTEHGDVCYNGLTFGIAITLLRCGFALRRSVWDKDAFIYHVPSAFYTAMTPIANRICDTNGNVHYSEYIAYFGKHRVVTIWTPTAIDIFAEDWEIISL